MSQEKFWNWKDDDNTFRLNWQNLTILPYGLYSGFTANLQSGMNLILEHEETKVKQDLTKSDPMGVWKSKQGVVITEDSSITIPITDGDSSNDRIDLIVGQHRYIKSKGGAAALYVVIQGVPSVNPSKPTLTIPNEQVVLGYLLVPQNSTDLSGAVYTKADHPLIDYLASLKDVSLSSPGNRDILLYDGSQWENESLKTGIEDTEIKMNQPFSAGLIEYNASFPLFPLDAQGNLTLPPQRILYVNDDRAQSSNTSIKNLADSSPVGTEKIMIFKDYNYPIVDTGNIEFVGDFTLSTLSNKTVLFVKVDAVSDPNKWLALKVY